MKILIPFICLFLLLSCQKDDDPIVDNGNEIFKVVEDNPAFQGCEDISNKAEKKACSDEKLQAFIEEHLKYPLAAKLVGVEGMVKIKLVVEADGSITEEEIVRDIGYGCGKEALRIVNLMPPWEPGKQRGTPVRVQQIILFNFEM